MKNDRKKCMRKLFLGWLLSFAQVSINDLRVWCNNVRGWWDLGLRPSFQIFPYLIVIQEKYLKLSIFCSWEKFENSKNGIPRQVFFGWLYFKAKGELTQTNSTTVSEKKPLKDCFLEILSAVSCKWFQRQ